MAIIVLIAIIAVTITCLVVDSRTKKQQRELLNEVLDYLGFMNIDSLLKAYDDSVTVKSRQTLVNYDDIKYLKEHDCFDSVKEITETRKNIRETITFFLKQNIIQ